MNILHKIKTRLTKRCQCFILYTSCIYPTNNQPINFRQGEFQLYKMPNIVTTNTSENNCEKSCQSFLTQKIEIADKIAVISWY